MNLEDGISSLKTFFLEILGFLLPGLVFWFAFYFFVKPHNQEDINLQIKFDGVEYFLLVVSYVFGYVLHGICEWINENRFLKKWIGSQNWEDKIIGLPSYKRAIGKVNEGILEEDKKIQERDVKSVRNFAMSTLPEIENHKIYTFMFRAELSFKIAASFILLLILVCLSILTDTISYKYSKSYLGIFKADGYAFVCYFLIFISALFLIKTYRRFYNIAMKLPLSIFISDRYASRTNPATP